MTAKNEYFASIKTMHKIKVHNSITFAVLISQLTLSVFKKFTLLKFLYKN